MEEVSVSVSVNIDNNVVVLFVTVDNVHEEKRLAFHFQLNLLTCVSAHQVDLDLKEGDKINK